MDHENSVYVFFNVKFIDASNSIPVRRWYVLMVKHVTVTGCWEIQYLSKVSDMRYPALRYRHTGSVRVSATNRLHMRPRISATDITFPFAIHDPYTET